MKKKLKMIFVLLLILNSRTFSQMEVFEDSEELFYDVYYSFINVGWVKFYTQRVPGKVDTYKCYADLKSNDAMPFISVDYHFESEMRINNGKVEPLMFTAKEKKDEKTSLITYVFNYDSGFAAIKKIGFDGKTEYERKQTLNTNYQDGLSIFYDARYHSFKNGSRDAAVLMNNDSMGLAMNFNLKRDGVSISEVKDDVASVFMKGFTNYKLVYGLTGEFKGWFTDDNARVPLKSHLEVSIGKVTLELSWWKRKGWTPPVAN